MKLQTRLSLAFLVLSLLSMAVIAGVSFFAGRQQILNDAFSRLIVTNHLTAEDFDRWLENSERTLGAIAQRPLVVDLSQKIASGASSDQDALVGRLLEVHFQPRLQEVEFEALMLLDPATGEVLASTDPDQIGKFREQEVYFREGRQQTTVQTIYYSVTEQRPRLTVATPVRDESGQLVGVLAGHLNLAELARIFSTPFIDRESEESYLVNGRGLAISGLLYRPDAVLQTWVSTPGVMECLAGNEIQGQFHDYRDVSVLGVYNWLPEYNLCLVTEIDEAVALQPILEFRSSVIAFGLLLALVVAGLGYAFTGQLAKPVVKMRQVAQSYRQGDLSARMQLPSTEEYRELAREFNRMATELQQDLEALEQRYESLFESVPVGLYQSNPKGELLEVNQALADILGYVSREELQSTPSPLLYVNPSVRDDWLRQLKEAGTVQNFEIQVRRKDGDAIWLRHDARLSITSEGEDVIEGAVFDTTLRHRAEIELIRERDFSNTLLDALPGVVYVLDPEGRFQRWNDNFQKVTGYSHEEFAKLNALDLFEGSDKELVAERIGRVFEEGEASVEAEITTKDGSKIPFSFTGLRNMMDGEPRLIGMGIDISLQRQALEELATIFEMSIDMICVADLNQGTFLKVNPAFTRILGYDQSELEGAEFDKFIHPDDIEPTNQVVENQLRRGETVFNFENRYRCKNGEYKWLEWVAAPDPDRGQSFSIARDITQRKMDESVMRELNERLVRSNKELEQFAYVASHDLQEPLRMVASYVKLLERRYGDLLDGEAKEFIEFAVDGAQRMQQLISDLLKFSRVGTQGKELVSVDSQQVVDSVIHTLGQQIEETAGRVEIEGDLPEVMADPGQLHQVFQNLISNGLKFTNEGSPLVRVSASKNGSKWRFAVADNGIGIDPKFSDRLFVIFQRLHTRREYKGNGIGLAVSKKIVERHGGQIWFESEPGIGSTFYFTISNFDQKEQANEG